MDNKRLTVGLIAVAIIAVGGYFFPLVQSQLGSGTRMPNGISADSTSPSAGQVRGTTLTITGASTLGSAGSSLTALSFGTCSLVAYTGGFTVAATTTVGFDCAATGALTTDTAIFVQTATSSVASSGGWEVESVSASSTAGYLRVHVRNNTGASAVMPASVASSTRWTILR